MENPSTTIMSMFPDIIMLIGVYLTFMWFISADHVALRLQGREEWHEKRVEWYYVTYGQFEDTLNFWKLL